VSVGFIEGAGVGFVGTMVGESVGGADGLTDLVGRGVGACVGDGVGKWVGLRVGTIVGLNERLGAGVGSVPGSGVATIDGLCVGSGVGTETTCMPRKKRTANSRTEEAPTQGLIFC